MVKGSVVLVLGEERFLAREALGRLLEKHSDLDLVRFKGDEVTPAQVLDEVRTPALLGGGRAVVVENAGSLFPEGGLEAFAAYAQNPLGGSLLALQIARLDMRLKGAKSLREATRVVKCDPLPPREVSGWIGSRARQAYGLQMGMPAAEALRLRIGEDLGLLDGALARLKEQIAPRTSLMPEDITGSTEEQRSPILFEAANALEDRDLAAALRAIRGAFADGVRIKQDLVTEAKGVGPILLGNLHRAYLKLLRFHMLAQESKSDADAAKAVGMPAWRVSSARRHQLDQLAARHRHFVEADLALKRSAEEPRRVLEGLLVALLG
ncbi:MAG: DNA polymerase III subunit delta [Planctomycetota bacterium]